MGPGDAAVPPLNEPLGTALVLLGAVALVALVEGGLIWARSWAYFSLGWELPVEPLPLPELPEGKGETSSVRWEVQGERAWFWNLGNRQGLPGLHGRVLFDVERRRVRLVVRWSPPWTLVAGVLAVSVLIAVHGVVVVAVAVAAIGAAAILLAYRDAALGAAAELRWRWVSEDRDDAVE